MAALRDRAGPTMLEDRPRLRSADECRLRPWITIRAKRGRVRLFGGDDAVGRSACSVVRIWDDLFRRHPADGEPAVGVRYHRRRLRFRDRTLLRTTGFTGPQARSRERRSFHGIRRDAVY